MKRSKTKMHSRRQKTPHYNDLIADEALPKLAKREPAQYALI
jgi:hypothetical protein